MHPGRHLGWRAAALVDDELGADAAERAWRHVSRCAGCREAVEQQALVKRALGALPDPPAPRLDPAAPAAPALPAGARRRTTRLVAVGAVGAGALTAAAAVVLAGAPATPAPRPAPADVTGGLRAPERPAAVATAWTGTPVGSETSRAFRTDRTH